MAQIATKNNPPSRMKGERTIRWSQGRIVFMLFFFNEVLDEGQIQFFEFLFLTVDEVIYSLTFSGKFRNFFTELRVLLINNKQFWGSWITIIVFTP